MPPDVLPLILSHKRAGVVTTHRYVANCKICIEESQAAEYAKAYPNLEQIVHPDAVLGLWAKREWVRRNVTEQTGQPTVHLDDDAIGIYRVYRRLHGWKKSVMSAGRAYELLCATNDRAEKLGAFFWGLGQHAHPLTFNGLKPFRFGGYTPGGLMGFRKGWRGFWPDEERGDGCDYWASLINAYFHRFSFFDRRFTMAFRGTYSRAGGLNEFRGGLGEQVEHEVLKFLQESFGREVVVRNFGGPNAATHRIKNPARRQIVLPYKA